MYEYDLQSNSWEQVNDVLTNDDCDSFFGDILKLTQDGELFIECTGEAISTGQTGAIYYYVKQGTDGQYVLQQKITLSDGVPGGIIGLWN